MSAKKVIKLTEPEMEHEFSASHYNKLLYNTPATSSQMVNNDPNNNMVTVKGGFDNPISSIPINSKSIPQRESALSQSLKNSYSLRKPSVASRKDQISESYASSTIPKSINSNTNLAGSPRTVNLPIDAENPDASTIDIVARHLVTDDNESEINNSYTDAASSVVNGDEFDSLQLQGGDITREIYNWKRDHSRNPRRAKSFTSISRANSNTSNSVGNYGSARNLAEPDLNVNEILVPGGFRRSFIAQKRAKKGGNDNPAFFTKNFIEFLTLYGHFAGEEFLDDEEDESEDEEAIVEDIERQPLIKRGPKHKRRAQEANVSTVKAVLLLLKAFIGTGILFLPKGFLNGGLLFCVCTLVFFSAISYWCFLLLIDVRIKSKINSFGDIGESLFGRKMRISILTSIVLSQIGFAAAYIVFVAQNLKSVLIAVTGNEVSIPLLIFSQLLIFIPLSLTRQIAKLSGTALVADFFILLGIIYIYYTSISEIVVNNIKHVELFNPNDWTVFIGTAVFTYEGIGLLIPIQESMKHPEKFANCLGGVMIGITTIFVSIGAVCYLAYGADVQTVILNNFPQSSYTVNVIQLLYALAILLSTPLQLFPAIKIIEHGIFGAHKSGKYNLKIKWKKNVFRILLVVITSLISWVGNSDLDKFVAIIGSFACIPLIYIYPPMLHIKSFIEEMSTGNSFDENRNYLLNNYLACYFNVAVTIFGFFMMFYTSWDTMKSWIT